MTTNNNRLTMILSIVVGLLMCSCASVPRSYDDLDDMPGVNQMYFGPGMMSMTGALAKVAGADAAALTDHLTSLRTIVVDNSRSVKRIRPFIKDRVRALHAQPMFSTKRDSGEQFSVYATPTMSGSGQYTDVVMVTDTGTHMLVVIAQGIFTTKQLNELAH